MFGKIRQHFRDIDYFPQQLTSKSYGTILKRFYVYHGFATNGNEICRWETKTKKTAAKSIN